MEIVTGFSNTGPLAAGSLASDPPLAEVDAAADGAGAGVLEEADEQPASIPASSAAMHNSEIMVWKRFFIGKLLSLCTLFT